LSKREREVVKLLLKGKRNKQILHPLMVKSAFHLECAFSLGEPQLLRTGKRRPELIPIILI
jgi:hypothetical protein